MPVTTTRCRAAHHKDPTPCEGPADVVTILDSRGRETTACVHHGARLLASLDGGRVHPLAALSDHALEVCSRARTLPPYPWEIGL
ncbi:hypothetical protein CD790_27715 [Streptomyces sp. SAJ15]|nr:hypothetical protein CD790_27715 [Streptomyces sp. SAJ15]